MSSDDLPRMPEEGVRHELVRGELTTAPLRGFEEGVIVSRTGCDLGGHVDEHDLGDVTARIGCRLFSDPDTVRAPDVAFIARARVEATGRSEGYLAGAPDLAIEIVSPDDTSAEVHEKVLDWLAASTRLVLVVHPRPRTITAYRSATDIAILREADTLDASDVVDG
ncbi:MAG: Uma2 family endonuclease [Actinomycetota bacterium]|nr:Uma2 family endonuclease [Actinomycetota bacterium]